MVSRTSLSYLALNSKLSELRSLTKSYSGCSSSALVESLMIIDTYRANKYHPKAERVGKAYADLLDMISACTCGKDIPHNRVGANIYLQISTEKCKGVLCQLGFLSFFCFSFLVKIY